MYGAPLVAFTIVKPVAPDCAVSVAPVVTRPVGVTHAAYAVVQYSNFMEPTLPVLRIVKAIA